MRRLLIAAMFAALVAGCGERRVVSPTAGIDPVELVRILPTPDGLTFDPQSSKAATAADVQEALAGTAKAETAKKFEDELGYVDGAVRRWRGSNGAALTVVVSRWPRHQTATNVGGGAAEFPIAAGAQAWTPSDVPGARGSRTSSPNGGSRSLAFAIADLSIFVRGDGAIGDTVVVRALSRLTKPVRATVGSRGA